MSETRCFLVEVAESLGNAKTVGKIIDEGMDFYLPQILNFSFLEPDLPLIAVYLRIALANVETLMDQTGKGIADQLFESREIGMRVIAIPEVYEKGDDPDADTD